MRQAVILAGGLGKRFKKISGKLPKPMVPLFDKPILEHQIQQCVANNIKNIKLLVGYKSKFIIVDRTEYFFKNKIYPSIFSYI